MGRCSVLIMSPMALFQRRLVTFRLHSDGEEFPFTFTLRSNFNVAHNATGSYAYYNTITQPPCLHLGSYNVAATFVSSSSLNQS